MKLKNKCQYTHIYIHIIFFFSILQECGVTGRSYTYSELRDQTAAFAVNLQNKFGLQKDDVFAICLANSPEFPIASLGAIEAGLIVTTINPIYTAGCIFLKIFNCNSKNKIVIINFI